MGPEGGFKQVLPSCQFDIGNIPTFDVYSDLSLVIPPHIKGHMIYARAMTVPLVRLFLSTIYNWAKFKIQQFSFVINNISIGF